MANTIVLLLSAWYIFECFLECSYNFDFDLSFDFAGLELIFELYFVLPLLKTGYTLCDYNLVEPAPVCQCVAKMLMFAVDGQQSTTRAGPGGQCCFLPRPHVCPGHWLQSILHTTVRHHLYHWWVTSFVVCFFRFYFSWLLAWKVF